MRAIYDFVFVCYSEAPAGGDRPSQPRVKTVRELHSLSQEVSGQACALAPCQSACDLAVSFPAL